MLLGTLEIRVREATLLRILDGTEFDFDEIVLLGIFEACGQVVELRCPTRNPTAPMSGSPCSMPQAKS
jgi:hypothetical protein